MVITPVPVVKIGVSVRLSPAEIEEAEVFKTGSAAAVTVRAAVLVAVCETSLVTVRV